MDGKSISRRNALKKIGAAGVAGTLLSSIGTVSAQSDEYVSKKTARTIARNAAEQLRTESEFDDWRAQGVRSPQLYYAKVQTGRSVEYVPRAWVFAIEDRGDDVGHITIDAEQLEIPVLAYGRGTAPHKHLESARGVARARGASVHNRFLYHGGVEYGVETTDRRMVDLRGNRLKARPAVENVESLKPTHNRDGELSSQGEKLNAPDWSGSTDDSISGVPNWTESDDGGASSTDYGSGADTWGEWDGCTPIAASMVIGFHEGISEYQTDAREALIDRLHDDMNTDSGGVTDWWNIDNGISNYAEGNHSYNGNNNHFNIKGNVNDAVANDNPPLLNMVNGPYTKDKQWVNGHSVVVVGYRNGSGYYYHKVHNGYNTPPDRVSNGNWSDACITRITKQ